MCQRHVYLLILQVSALASACISSPKVASNTASTVARDEPSFKNSIPAENQLVPPEFESKELEGFPRVGPPSLSPHFTPPPRRTLISATFTTTTTTTTATPSSTTTTTEQVSTTTKATRDFPPSTTRTRRRFPRDCADIQLFDVGTSNGVYEIYRPGCLNPVACAMRVTCDLETDGGGWTVIQQRLDGATDFHRDWKSYKDGFGDVRNFWIGNEYLYEMTNMDNRTFQLLIQLADLQEKAYFSLYDNLRIEPESSNYRLSIGSMFGSSSVDNLKESRGSYFSSHDEDFTRGALRSCGAVWQSGWWYGASCDFSGDLNVPYEPSKNRNDSSHQDGIIWKTDDGPVLIRTTQMKIRPLEAFNNNKKLSEKPRRS